MMFTTRYCAMGQKITNISNDLLLRRILDSLNLLGECDREMFIMKHYQGCSEREISRCLNIPARHVRRSLSNSSRFIFKNLRSIRKQIVSRNDH
jgi:DNA-directed RNA polymerase specialized sigma24 family protein